jgi:hypothetical protein
VTAVVALLAIILLWAGATAVFAVIDLVCTLIGKVLRR